VALSEETSRGDYMMYEGLRILKQDSIETMNQEWQSDGSVAITLVKRGENKTYKFRVKDLYGEDEEVLEHEIIES
jgi:hypothetical protein